MAAAAGLLLAPGCAGASGGGAERAPAAERPGRAPGSEQPPERAAGKRPSVERAPTPTPTLCRLRLEPPDGEAFTLPAWGPSEAAARHRAVAVAHALVAAEAHARAWPVMFMAVVTDPAAPAPSGDVPQPLRALLDVPAPDAVPSADLQAHGWSGTVEGCDSWTPGEGGAGRGGAWRAHWKDGLAMAVRREPWAAVEAARRKACLALHGRKLQEVFEVLGLAPPSERERLFTGALREHVPELRACFAAAPTELSREEAPGEGDADGEEAAAGEQVECRADLDLRGTRAAAAGWGRTQAWAREAAELGAATAFVHATAGRIGRVLEMAGPAERAVGVSHAFVDYINGLVALRLPEAARRAQGMALDVPCARHPAAADRRLSWVPEGRDEERCASNADRVSVSVPTSGGVGAAADRMCQRLRAARAHRARRAIEGVKAADHRLPVAMQAVAHVSQCEALCRAHAAFDGGR
ncbi:MAG: hypothetical protein ACODAU_01230 [Myxococcota bacterium]